MSGRRTLGLGLMMGLVGCAPALAPAPAPVAQAPITLSPAPSAAPVAAAPSVAPSAGGAEPCDPATAAYRRLSLVSRVRAGEDWVEIGRCDERAVQVVGRSPEPFGIDTTNFSVAWVSPDRTSAIGWASPIGARSFHAARRWADGRPDERLSDAFDHSISVSPNGQFGAYWGYAGPDDPPGSMRLNLVRFTDRAHREMLAMGNEYARPIQWSPDSQRLLYLNQSLDSTFQGLEWTSWDEPTVHRLDKPDSPTVSWRLGASYSWAPDSRHILVYDQTPFNETPFSPGRPAYLVTANLDGHTLDRKPMLGLDGQHLTKFYPQDVMADNPVIVGHDSLLDTRTGQVTAVANEGLVGWSSEPGKLLHWTMTPDGPRLAVHPMPSPSP